MATYNGLMDTATTRTATSDPVIDRAAPPLAAPAATSPIDAARPRTRVVVTGLVVRVDPVRWVGGPVLEVDLRDPTGTLTLAFFGRRWIAGVQPGSVVTAAGTVGRREGRPLILNPQLWLHAERTEPFVAHPRPGTCVPFEQQVVAGASADQVGAVLAAAAAERSPADG